MFELMPYSFDIDSATFVNGHLARHAITYHSSVVQLEPLGRTHSLVRCSCFLPALFLRMLAGGSMRRWACPHQGGEEDMPL